MVCIVYTCVFTLSQRSCAWGMTDSSIIAPSCAILQVVDCRQPLSSDDTGRLTALTEALQLLGCSEAALEVRVSVHGHVVDSQLCLCVWTAALHTACHACSQQQQQQAGPSRLHRFNVARHLWCCQHPPHTLSLWLHVLYRALSASTPLSRAWLQTL